MNITRLRIILTVVSFEVFLIYQTLINLGFIPILPENTSHVTLEEVYHIHPFFIYSAIVIAGILITGFTYFLCECCEFEEVTDKLGRKKK